MSSYDAALAKQAAAMQTQSLRPAIIRKQIEELKAEKNPAYLDEIRALKNELAALAAAGHR